MAPLVKQFEKESKYFDLKVCVTAQHREMLDQVLELFEITPDYDLNIMKAGQDLYDVTVNVLLGMRKVISSFNPDVVFVHGDTTTTSATALAAFYQKVKVAHIEAGLRTNNLYSPWPEEANRQISGILSQYHFAPTLTSRDNLLKENKEPNNIVVTGNTVIDALHLALNKIKNSVSLESSIIQTIENEIKDENFSLDKSKFVLVTGHRRENHGQGFLNICQALKEVALANPDINIIYPVHLNPNVQEPVNKLLSNISNIYLIQPLQYEVFIYLMDKSYFIITDSGGIQEEAPSLGKPVLVMRDTTERPEALDAGTVKLVGVNPTLIVQEMQKLLNDEKAYEAMSKAHNPYGNGDACQKIVDFFIPTS